MSSKPRSVAFPKSILVVLALLSPLGCGAIEGDTRGAKRGAIGGALIGVTMGALTGDAGLAAAGAAAGAVAGGVAGSMTDLESDRDTERTQITADAIAGRPAAAGAAPEASQPQGWDQLDIFPGTWNCTIWGLDAEGNRLTATAKWTGSLVSTRAARLSLDSFDLADFDDAVDAQLTGHCQLSYDPTNGYELVNVFATTPDDQRWVGERVGGEARYNFYYVGTSDTGNLGSVRRENRVELRFVGRDLFFVDTYAQRDGAEIQIQSYRFTRSS
jgi:hypothetical protein